MSNPAACPHCRAIARVSPHRELRAVCDVCGGPRISVQGAAVELSGRELAPLRRAEAARRGRAGWRAAAVVGGLLLPSMAVVFSVLLLVLGAHAGLVAAALLFCAPPLVLLFVAIARIGARSQAIPAALDEAWLSAASDAARQAGGAISAAELAAKLGIEEPMAEEMLAMLDAEAAAGGPRVGLWVEAVPPTVAAEPVEEAEAAAEPPAVRNASMTAGPGKP
jgi:hypothetical protein